MYCMDDHACGQEEKRLKKGMRHKVKHGGRPCSQSKREEHVSDLTNGGIRQYSLHIALGECTKGRQQHGGSSDERYQELNRGCQSEKHMRARDQIHSCGD